MEYLYKTKVQDLQNRINDLKRINALTKIDIDKNRTLQAQEQTPQIKEALITKKDLILKMEQKEEVRQQVLEILMRQERILDTIARCSDYKCLTKDELNSKKQLIQDIIWTKKQEVQQKQERIQHLYGFQNSNSATFLYQNW